MMNTTGSHSGWTTSLRMISEMRGDHQGQGWQRFTELYSVLLNYWFQQEEVPMNEWADLRQEVFLAVAKGLHQFEHDPAMQSFRGWLRVITRNKIADLYRTKHPLANSELLTNQISQEQSDTTLEKKMLYHKALDLICTDFTPTTWQSFWLVVVEGRPAADVAQALGISLASVYVNKSRVLKRLRTELQEFIGDETTSIP